MSIHINGAKEVEALLKQLPERLAKNVTTNALRAGARIIAKRAREIVVANPSIDSGLLAKNITARARRRSRQGRAYGAATVSVGVARVAKMVVRKGKKKAEKASPSRYAHLVEFGHDNVPAEPFLRPALDEKAIEAITRIGEFLGRGVEREAAKLAAGKVSFVTGKRIK
ncbi:hypothetical protein BH10PSE12_BH10PSE12_02720 [soil metagenome]